MSSFHIELFKFFFVFSFSLGLWTCINLIFTRRNDRYIRGALITYILLLLNAPINAYFSLIQAESVGFLSAIGQKLSWIYGPLLAILVNRLLLKKIGTLHLTLNVIPFVFFATDQALQLHCVTFWQYILLLYIQIACYLGYALISASSHRNQLKRINNNYRNGSYYWAMHLCCGLVIVMIWDLIIVSGLYLGLINSLTFITVLACAFSIYISTLALLFIYQPAILTEPTSDTTTPEISPIATPILRSVELSPEAANKLQIKLEQLIKTHQPHQDTNISLRKLALLMGITSHQLSELLNIHMGVSFYDYLNNLRHEESIKLLSNTQQSFSITDIAYRSGYNNRNSFYKIFKEKTGLTPTEFKKTYGIV